MSELYLGGQKILPDSEMVITTQPLYDIPASEKNTIYTCSKVITPPTGYKFLGIGALSNGSYGQSLTGYSYNVNTNTLSVSWENNFGSLGVYSNGGKATIFWIRS